MKDIVKIGYLGSGRRGRGMLEFCFCQMKDVEITMLCDQSEEALKLGRELIVSKGCPEPILTTSYDDMLNNPELDAIIIMTGWEDRAELASRAMLAGKYTAIEVGCAYDISECHQLIEAYEKSGSPLMMLENCCYGRREMMALRLAEEGLFGEIVHCDGGYHHYLPTEDLIKNGDVNHYRINNYIHRNCEQYPTHEFGPIAKILKLNRGNKMLTLSSFASKSKGLNQAAKEILGEDHPYSKIEYKQGDIITTVITCANGETIHLCLDTTLPRPYYSRNFTVRGTKGMYTEERRVVYFSGMDGVEDNEEEMYKLYDHPLQKEYYDLGVRGGHDGIDWLVCRAFIESVKRGTNTPIDAYDTVSWMAIAPLSEMSISKGGAPVNVPDFTKGKWIHREPIVEGKYCLDKVCVDENTKIIY